MRIDNTNVHQSVSSVGTSDGVAHPKLTSCYDESEYLACKQYVDRPCSVIQGPLRPISHFQTNVCPDKSTAGMTSVRK